MPDRRAEAVVCRGGGATRREERPVREPRRGEVLLRVRACGLCGTDLVKLGAGTAPAGTVLGHEVVGDVVEAPGEPRDATGRALAAGDRVVAPHHVPCGDCVLCRAGSETQCAAFRENLLEPGGFSSFLVVAERGVRSALRAVPGSVPDEAAVFLEPAACVLRGVERSDVPSEGAAAVIGAGSMGLLHLLVLRSVRPGLRVVAVDPIAERRELAIRLGAHAAVAPEDARKVLWDAEGGGAAAVFDCAGGAGPLEAGVALLRPGGSLVLFAHGSPGERAALDVERVFRGERRVIGSYSGTPREQEVVHRLLVEGRLDPAPLVTARLPFARFEEAVRRTRTHRDLKVLLVPGAGPA